MPRYFGDGRRMGKTIIRGATQRKQSSFSRAKAEWLALYIQNEIKNYFGSEGGKWLDTFESRPPLVISVSRDLLDTCYLYSDAKE